MIDEGEIGKLAYEAYVNKAGGRSLITGANLPTWEEQGQEVKEAWEAAAIAVVEYLHTA